MKTAATLAAIAAFIGIVAWTMAQQGKVQSEVCVSYRRQTGCKTSTAPTRDDALAAAQSGVCGELSGSMTRDLECMRTPPVSAQCGE